MADNKDKKEKKEEKSELNIERLVKGIALIFGSLLLIIFLVKNPVWIVIVLIFIALLALIATLLSSLWLTIDSIKNTAKTVNKWLHTPTTEPQKKK